MQGCRWLLLVLLLAGGVTWAAEPLPKKPLHARLASEVWLDYTNADGTGLAWELLRKVFEPVGVKVKTASVPYSRAIGLVKRGEADAWVGSYHEESADNIYPRWHFDQDHIYALGLASRPVPTRKRWVSSNWLGCVVTISTVTCPMLTVTARFSGVRAFCRCLSMVASISTSMP